MPTMNFRKAQEQDFANIWNLIEQAKILLEKEGSDQWQNGYPTPSIIHEDIALQTGYVLLENNKVCAYASLCTEEDPNYSTIWEGKWEKEDEKYTSIHRICVDSSIIGKGLGRIFMQKLLIRSLDLGFYQVRIDTHEKNLRMQKLVKSLNFKYAGIVQVSPGPVGKRLAFQWINEKN